MEKFYAKFEYGTPSLIKVEVTKETPKTYQVAHEYTIILGNWYYLSSRVEKEDSIFDTQEKAIDYLIERNTQWLERARKEVKRLEDSLNELDKMLEGLK